MKIKKSFFFLVVFLLAALFIITWKRSTLSLTAPPAEAISQPFLPYFLLLFLGTIICVIWVYFNARLDAEKKRRAHGH